MAASSNSNSRETFINNLKRKREPKIEAAIEVPSEEVPEMPYDHLVVLVLSLTKNVQSLEKDVQSLEKDVQSLEKDVQSLQNVQNHIWEREEKMFFDELEKSLEENSEEKSKNSETEKSKNSEEKSKNSETEKSKNSEEKSKSEAGTATEVIAFLNSFID
jgi:hypothetical protein